MKNRISYEMANKILLNSKSKGDVGDFYEPSDSEEEYTAREKALLQKVRKGRHRDVSREQEILAFNENAEDSDENDGENYDDDDDDFNEKFEADSDIEDGDQDDGIPDQRAWGNKRRDFHSTDFVDQDYSSYTAKEEELAEQEESEARAIQQRLAKQLAESDFTLDVFSTAEPSEKEKKEKKTEIYMKKDLSQLSHRQKEQLFKKDSPEFDGLVGDFRERLTESVQLLEPILSYFKENSIETHALVEFIENQNQLIVNYCTNVSFYLVLKAKRIPIKNHPIVKRLVQIRQLLLQTEEKYTNVVKPQLQELLESIKEGKEFKIVVPEVSNEKKTKKLRFVEAFENGGENNENDSESDTANNKEDMDFTQKLKLMDSESEQENNGDQQEDDEEIDGEEIDARRQITYQIAKNKGLTPYRKKELRNPRVKHRNKFRKALIRRKGAVQTVRKEIKRYDGEIFGIKATVKKGIKIK